MSNVVMFIQRSLVEKVCWWLCCTV